MPRRKNITSENARHIQNWGEQHPQFHSAEMKRWRKKWKKDFKKDMKRFL